MMVKAVKLLHQNWIGPKHGGKETNTEKNRSDLALLNTDKLSGLWSATACPSVRLIAVTCTLAARGCHFRLQPDTNETRAAGDEANRRKCILIWILFYSEV